MPNKAVFLNRDGTLLEEARTQPNGTGPKLLLGVEQALNSLTQAGYLVVLLSRRGPGTSAAAGGPNLAVSREDDELRRQLREKGAHPVAFYCWPDKLKDSPSADGADASEGRIPSAALTRAAHDLDIDLSRSWIVGDGGDVQAGRRAGCHAIRLTAGEGDAPAGPAEDPPGTARPGSPDFTVETLAEAARIIVLHGEAIASRAAVRAPSPPRPRAEASMPRALAQPGPATPATRADAPHPPAESPAAPPAPPAQPAPAAELELPHTPPPQAEAAGRDRPIPDTMTDSEVLRELLRHARQLAQLHHHAEFSVRKLLGGVFQGLAAFALLWAVIKFCGLGAPAAELNEFYLTMAWLGIAAVLQLVALTFFLQGRQE